MKNVEVILRAKDEVSRGQNEAQAALDLPRPLRRGRLNFSQV